MLELPVPGSPAPDEAVIVRAAGVGNWDEIVRAGGWDVGRRPPLALGVEAAGVVTAVGEEVATLAPGDDVLTHPAPLRHQGAWAERLVAPATLVVRKPAAVPWQTAAAFPVPALTADQTWRDRAWAGWRMGARERRRWRDGRPRRAARGDARSNCFRDRGGLQAPPSVRSYGATAVFEYHDPEWPARVRNEE